MTSTKLLHRKNASDTSIKAAEKLDAVGLEYMVLIAIREAGEIGMTQGELLAKFCEYPYSSITARPAALKRKGLVFDSGLRRKSNFSRKQIVLVAK